MLCAFGAARHTTPYNYIQATNQACLGERGKYKSHRVKIRRETGTRRKLPFRRPDGRGSNRAGAGPPAVAPDRDLEAEPVYKCRGPAPP